MWIRKASGELEKFDPKKIKKTCLRAGASPDLANNIVKQVTRRIKKGMTTKDVLNITLGILRKHIPDVARRYDLKGALLRLGPAGFPFEHLFAEILKEHGYGAVVHKILKGHCIEHEIDIVATKPVRAHASLNQPPLKYFMVECKYHNSPGVFTGVKDILYTYARFLDLKEGWKEGKCQKFDKPWLVSNTKFSSDTIAFANCRKIKLTGWKYPVGNSLEDLIEKKNLYPITMMKKLDRKAQIKLSKVGLMLCRDLLKRDVGKLNQLTGIPKTKLTMLKTEATKLCQRF
jgi:hypothetical protein